MKPLLALVMIVKDEAKSIRKVLECVRPHVDRWTILDTGSTDATKTIIHEVLDGLPGTLFEEPFVDYATSRNRVLDLEAANSQHAEFTLMVSGDEYLRGGEKLREHLDPHRSSKVNCHFVRVMLDDTTLLSPRVLRVGSAWRYEGIVHEVPMNRAEKDAPMAATREVLLEHIVSDPERRYATIWEKHIPLLKAQVEENPEDVRALIFLAQSYESLFPFFSSAERVSYAMEAMALYLRRLAIDNGNEIERNFVKMQYLDDARIAGVYTDEELHKRATDLVAVDPHRPEPALLLAQSAVKIRPLLRVYELACRAAQVAAEVGAIDNSSPVSTACGWKAHHLAAVAAKQLAKKHSEFAPRIKEHVTAGLAAGGSWEVFKAVSDPPKPKVTDETAP